VEALEPGVLEDLRTTAPARDANSRCYGGVPLLRGPAGDLWCSRDATKLVFLARKARRFFRRRGSLFVEALKARGRRLPHFAYAGRNLPTTGRVRRSGANTKTVQAPTSCRSCHFRHWASRSEAAPTASANLRRWRRHRETVPRRLTHRSKESASRTAWTGQSHRQAP